MQATVEVITGQELARFVLHIPCTAWFTQTLHSLHVKTFHSASFFNAEIESNVRKRELSFALYYSQHQTKLYRVSINGAFHCKLSYSSAQIFFSTSTPFQNCLSKALCRVISEHAFSTTPTIPGNNYSSGGSCLLLSPPLFLGFHYLLLYTPLVRQELHPRDTTVLPTFSCTKQQNICAQQDCTVRHWPLPQPTCSKASVHWPNTFSHFVSPIFGKTGLDENGELHQILTTVLRGSPSPTHGYVSILFFVSELMHAFIAWVWIYTTSFLVLWVPIPHSKHMHIRLLQKRGNGMIQQQPKIKAKLGNTMQYSTTEDNIQVELPIMHNIMRGRFNYTNNLLFMYLLNLTQVSLRLQFERLDLFRTHLIRLKRASQETKEIVIVQIL